MCSFVIFFSVLDKMEKRSFVTKKKDDDDDFGIFLLLLSVVVVRDKEQ